MAHYFAISIMPAMFDAITQYGISARALAQGLVSLDVIDPRDFAFGNYRRIDDRPYGGGAGMVMMAEPLGKAIEFAKAKAQDKGVHCPVLYLSPQGKTLDEAMVQRLGRLDGLVLLCGRYEGVDERVIERYVDESVSIGDYVLSGGELAAMVLLDSLIRRVPCAIDAQSADEDSFVDGLLDCPHYTRPWCYQGMEVPEILRSGDHQKIAAWRHAQKQARTQKLRPDLWQRYVVK